MINEKELCKQIKKSAKIGLIWTIQEGMNYITNRHWAVRYREVPRDVLVALFSVFAQLPEEGQTLNFTFGQTVETNVNVKRVFDESNDNDVKGKVTSYLSDSYGPYMVRIINSDKGFIYIKDDYMKMVGDEEPLCKGINTPVSFCDNNFIILPVRVSNNNDNTLHDLIAV